MRLAPAFGVSLPLSLISLHLIIPAILQAADQFGMLATESIIRTTRLHIGTQGIIVANDADTGFDFSVCWIASLTSKAAGKSIRVEMLDDSGKVCRALRPPTAIPHRGNDYAKSEAHFGLGQLRRILRLYG